MSVIVANLLSDLCCTVRSTLKELTCTLHAHLGQIFHKILPGFLLKDRAEIAWTDSDMCSDLVQRKVALVKMLTYKILCIPDHTSVAIL